MRKPKDNRKREAFTRRKGCLGIHSLKGRVLAIMLVSILLWLLFVILLFAQNYRKNQEEMEKQLEADTLAITLSMERQYTSLLKISQQMTNNSVIGNSFESFLTAADRYDRIRQTTQLQTTISSVIFNYDYGTMACYYRVGEEEEEMVLSNYPVRQEEPSAFQAAASINEISYQSLHEPLNEYLHVPVVSIIRKVSFEGKDYLIYVEGSSEDVRKNLEARTRNMEYTFLQLDEQGEVLGVLGYQDANVPTVGTRIGIDLDQKKGNCQNNGESFVYCVQEGFIMPFWSKEIFFLSSNGQNFRTLS